nr:cysteine-rich KTR domain-containing protein [Lachnoclostridium sp. An138]
MCPICKGKTRQKATKETYLKNFPLFCPKCKCQSIIDLIEGEVTVREAVYRQEKE